MDFFQRQDDARKNTGRLIILFCLAVIAIIVMVYFAVTLTMFGIGSSEAIGGEGNFGSKMFDPMIMLGVSGGTIGLVGVSSLYKIIELRSGGGAHVAEMLDGRLVDPSDRQPADRQLLNIVEEMAIASGTPVPPVYIMENENSINAFAAGYAPHDAVIGVSRGSVDMLTRDELQGVVAHEFSHVLNGDMKMNIRLIGILNGILVIGLIGQMVLRTAAYSGGSRRSNSKDGGGAGAILLLALALVIIGSVGTFFGKWIKAAVSRQREYLADASAVQFTRLPEGIGNALRKIGGSVHGANLNTPRAGEMSHMFFGDAISRSFGSMFSTHPPLPERIAAVMKDWDGTFIKPMKVKTDEQAESQKRGDGQKTGQSRVPQIPGIPEIPGMPGGMVGGAVGGVILGGAMAAGAANNARMGSAVDQIGNPTQAHLDYAKQLVASIPAEIRNAVHQTYSARAVIYALLLNRDEAARAKQWERLDNHAAEGTLEVAHDIESELLMLDQNARLPLLDMCIPALREMAVDQFEDFLNNVQALIEADQQIDIFEWALMRILRKNLDAPPLQKRRKLTTRLKSMAHIQQEVATLLSNLAYAGNNELPMVEQAFNAGAAQMQMPGMKLLPFDQVSLPQLDATVDLLAHAAPVIRGRIIRAAAACIAADRTVTSREGELLRAFSDILDAPMPPILPGQPLV